MDNTRVIIKSPLITKYFSNVDIIIKGEWGISEGSFKAVTGSFFITGSGSLENGLYNSEEVEYEEGEVFNYVSQYAVANIRLRVPPGAKCKFVALL